MKVLFIDTATSFLRVALVSDDKLVYFYNNDEGHDMSSMIMPVLDMAFKEAGFKPSDLDKIMAVNGPGSFTGIRVGLTVAKTMAWALKIPVISISSLEVISSGFDSDYNTSLINARRGYAYVGSYDDNLNVISDDRHEYIKDKKFDGNLISYDEFDFEVNQPIIDVLKVVRKHINDEEINPHNLNPKYLKLTEAEEKFNNND